VKRTQIRRKTPMRAEGPTCQREPKPHAERACKHCGREFLQLRPMQAVCSAICAARKVKAARAQEKKSLRERKAALKTIPELKREAQRAFNAWIRDRDKDQPCISCGKPPGDLTKLHAGRDAGHYRSTGSADHLRFHEDNCHAQCVHCNQWGAGRAVDYRIGLVARIGLERVEALESNNESVKWTRDLLIGIRDTYKAKLKDMRREAE
jgi:hypothetical protein